MNDLHLVDCWHFQHPALQKFTSPTGTSRIDYVFVNYRLFRSTSTIFLPDFGAKSGTGNHIGLSFRLVSACFKPSRRAPWKCPVWVIKLPEAQDYLSASIHKLAESFFPGIWKLQPRILTWCTQTERLYFPTWTISSQKERPSAWNRGTSSGGKSITALTGSLFVGDLIRWSFLSQGSSWR